VGRETRISRHEQVRANVIGRLQHYRVGARLPSDRDLAEELGVAYLTVNRVMRELAWQGYVERRPRKGTFLASREKTIENDLNTGTPPGERVVFAYPNYFSFATWTRVRSAEEQAVKRGLGLVEFKMNSDTSYGSLCELVRATQNVRGVLIVPVPDSVDRSIISLLDGLEVPVVLLAACEMASLGRRIWSVTADWYRMGYLMAESLIRAGHRKLAYLHNEPDSQEWRRALRGIRRAVSEGRLRRRDFAVLGRGIRPWQDSRDAGHVLTAEALAPVRPTGLMFDSFNGALGGLRAVWERGLVVPEDVSLVSDGVGSGQEDYTIPPLTTVDARPGEEVRLAFECVLGGSVVESRNLAVPPVLNTRQSVARPPAAERSGRAARRA
jgi:DNA-binding LacI/PurR family transcriptional regulator